MPVLSATARWNAAPTGNVLPAMRLLLCCLAAALTACGGGSDADFRSSAPEQPAVPAEFAAACGKPGSTVQVRAQRVAVKRADCDLRGVTLMHKEAGAVVPGAPGESVQIFQDAPVGGQSQSAAVSVDEETGDVTFIFTSSQPLR